MVLVLLFGVVRGGPESTSSEDSEFVEHWHVLQIVAARRRKLSTSCFGVLGLLIATSVALSCSNNVNLCRAI